VPIVVDANVAIKWIAPEELRPEARELLNKFIHQVEAPDFILAEVANIAWMKQRRGEVTNQEAEEGLRFIRSFISTLHSSNTLCERALALALALDHSVYDCFYLACAEATASVLFTADRRLHDDAARSGFGHLVRHLAEVELP
jgi:predicted nucleic acid-binding protein